MPRGLAAAFRRTPSPEAAVRRPSDQASFISTRRPRFSSPFTVFFVPAPSHAAGELDEHRAAEYRRVRSSMLAAEQDAILGLRDDEVIADDVMRRIQRDLDLEAMLLETSEPVSETVRDIPSSINAASR